MFEILTNLLNSWMAIPIIAIVTGMSIPVVAIIAYYWFELQKYREDSELKRCMIERGMSVEEIERALAAKSTGDEE